MSTFLRLPDVIAKTGLRRSTVYELVAAGEFPAPVKIGKRSAAWIEAEVVEWMRNRVAERDAKAA